MPVFFRSIPVHAIEGAMTNDPGAAPLTRIPNSIDTLSPNNRFVREVEKFPTTRGFHFTPLKAIVDAAMHRTAATASSPTGVPIWKARNQS